MNIKKFLATALAGCMMLALLAGCSGDSEDTTSSSGDASTTTESSETVLAADQTLTLLFDSPLTLDVSDARNYGEFVVMSQVQETLLRDFIDEDGNQYAEFAGAESYTISDDQLVYTFAIRENTWSDGVAVTAQHYADSFIRILDAEQAYSYAFLAYDIKNAEEYYNQQSALMAVEAGSATDEQIALVSGDILTVDDIGVKALDDNTLEITLDKESPTFIKKLAFAPFAPIRLDAIEAATDGWETDPEQVLYCGPFVIESWVAENSMTLVPNEYYWDRENVILDKVEMVVAEEVSTQAQLFESGALDVVEGQTSEYIERWSAMAEDGDFNYVQSYYPQNNYLTANHLTGGPSGLMQNQKVRLALALAIDRDELTEFVYGRYTPAYGVIPQGVSVGDLVFRDEIEEPLLAAYEEYAGDAEKLQALFKEGMAEAGVTGDLEDVTLIYLTTGSDSVSKSVQEYLQQTFKTVLGIDIRLDVLESNAFREQRNNNEYDMVLMGWHGDYNDPLTFIDMWISNGGYSQYMGWYASDEYDAMLEELDTLTSDEDRLAKYAELEEQLILTDAGIIPLYYGDQNYFVQSNVENLHFPLFGTSIEFSRTYITE